MSGSVQRWVGGNNTFTGSPNTGIDFTNEGYPLMDSGYNYVDLSSTVLLNGDIPSSLEGYLYTRMNYWANTSSSYFKSNGGDIIYTPYWDGNTLPSTNDYELNSIGFGLYDTVYTYTSENNQGEDLFMQAYQYEMQGQYTNAKNTYQQVIANHKTTSYATVSLSRIFNCLEKNNSSNSDYQAIQTYYNSIKSDTTNPTGLRETSEDFVIKAKVKQGQLEEAIEDYQAMYQQNQNNSKGLHAQVNKQCLIAMQNDSGDNMNSGTNHMQYLSELINNQTHSQLLSRVTPNLPTKFSLEQNYPNPFNPTTKIKYQLPNNANVTIKIYDISGREVRTLVNEYKKAGYYDVSFDGSNLASGVYFYRIEAGTFTDSKKMVLIK